jgi:Polysulfide reductase
MNDNEVRSYHGQPVLKEPVWTWEIPFYFFTGGLAGASAGLAYTAELRGNYILSRRAWACSLAGITASPALLVSDLGRPERFLNMLRVFKPTSPMSVGSWILSGSGAFTALATANAWTGLFPRTATVAKPVAALLGLPLSTYTAALVANTAVPVWHEARTTLPFVFGAGAALSAGAAAVALTPTEHAAPARRVALAGALAEGAANELMRRALGEHGEPYKTAPASRFDHASRVSVIAGAGLLARRGRNSRAAAAIAGALLLTGAITARWSVFKAGFESAADPRYTIVPQRRRIEQGQTRGGARSQSHVATADPSRGSPATV